ncbi:MAG: hypothetical protein Q4Q53_00005 [Methanocorpusculum sp.]|nr:hypothetical protein [Methanocorpusculum sp.]
MPDTAYKNPGRQTEIDFIKFFAIIAMIFVHVYERFILQEIYTVQTITAAPDGIISFFFEFFGGPAAAPVFMFCLGIGIIYSKRSTAKHLFSRAWIILGIAFLLSLFSDVIPRIVLYFATGDMSYITLLLDWFLKCDILNFAFLVFLFFVLVKIFKLNNIIVFIIPVILLLVSYFVSPSICPENPIVNLFAGWMFWQNNDFSFFPFAQWLIYPVMGYLFGQLLINTGNKGSLYKKVTLICGAGFVFLTFVYLILGVDIISFFTTFNGIYYNQNCLSVLWTLLFIGLWTGVIYFAVRKIKTGFLLNISGQFSKKITNVYCAQWVIIGSLYYYAAIPLGVLPVSYTAAVILAVCIIIASYICASVYLKAKKNIFKRGAV